MPIPAIDLSYLVQGQLADAVPDVTKPLGELETGINDVLAGDVGFEQVNLGADSEVTISAGAVTITRTHHSIDTEGNAASDDLVTINGGTAGDMLLLRLADASRTVVVNHNTGNIFLTNEQDFALDNANKSLALFFTGSKWTNIGGGGVGGSRRLFAQTADVVIGNTTTETSLFGSGVGSLTLPANTLSAGECIRIRITGSYKTDFANAQYTIRLKMNGGTLVSVGFELLTLNLTDQYFEIDILMTLRAVGATGTIYADGRATFADNASDAGRSDGMAGYPGSLDTTIDQVIDVTWQWVAAYANHEITARQALVEVI